jgi:hypothetical protein
MDDRIQQALAAAQALRRSAGYASLSAAERSQLDRDLTSIEQTLSGGPPVDPYAVAAETPADLARGGGPMVSRGQPAAAPAAPAPTPRPAGTEVIGARARQALEAVDFPSFVAELIRGTFQAIVDATAQQVREYAGLVASIAQSVSEFSRKNVSGGQVRMWLAERFPADLRLVVPEAGSGGYPQLLPRRRSTESPEWLAQFGLEDEELTPELTEGALLEAARNAVGQERMQTLATMVLLGINRIVVNDGEIKARLQFHASAKESVQAQIGIAGAAAQGNFAGRDIQTGGAVSTMVSTVSLNAQADVAVRANLVGEVALKFRSETFNLERFADSQAIELINTHSRLRQSAPSAPPTGPGPTSAPVNAPAQTPANAPANTPAQVGT